MSAFWSQLLFAVVGIIVMAAAALYHFVLDGSLPAKSSFMLDLERARALARAGGADRPHSIEVEFLAIDEIPKMGAIAGLNRMPLRMVRTSFQLRSDWGNTVIDVGMDRNVSARFQSGLIDFDDDSLMRIRAAIQRARIIAVTHEHPDHMGLLLRLSDLEERLDRLRLTEAQIFAAALYTSNTEQLGFLNSVEPLPDDGPQLIAPGIVMIPAAGHTPGSVMYFVSNKINEEFLFVGDIVWTMENIDQKLGRSRLVQNMLMQSPEDREKVHNQIAALVALHSREPDLLIIPSHDARLLHSLVDDGVLAELFSGI